MTGKPTYWPIDDNKVPDLLDFFISKKLSYNFIEIKDNFEQSSECSPNGERKHNQERKQANTNKSNKIFEKFKGRSRRQY